MTNHRVSKTRQTHKKQRVERLRALLQLTPSDSILLDACSRQNAADVKALLEALPSVNPDTIRDKHLRTPLHIACSRRDDLAEATAVARVLIQAGSDVNNGVGDVDGFQPMHMAVLAGNFKCVLMLLQEGASVPASDPFRLTPLLLAKLKLDNLRQTHALPRSLEKDVEEKSTGASVSSSALNEYEDLTSITKVLVSHLANKHITKFGNPRESANFYGLSDFLFAKEKAEAESQLDETIANITDQLSTIQMDSSSPNMSAENTERKMLLMDTMNSLIEKLRNIGISELDE
ncbi:uncharacterized protein BYT42DRAFT_576417 [Radiomyces spectabilis]|uniref:uncharacterized protein n=1 Tax=Radiomyces spectabilis TaxID=64574 RepID=UPI00221E4EE6|nr:uncharacterized protein BYT42DRAFT_576417 [Radiomyces spectabilis]KAI8374454.1 hypothetical protein BYT42DRAFT_576417 [Radiomyces spectabilis]